MKNYKLEISYDGTCFSGWQVQKNNKTVQGCLEGALKEILKINNINLIGAGRTDAGVHANAQSANVILDTQMTCDQIRKAINSKLSRDIFITNCIEVDVDFNSRFSAIKREYIYYITDDFSPMKRHYFWQNKRKLNRSTLKKCANMVLGDNDFTLFSKASSKTKNKVCTIYESYWKFDDDFISYTIIGNRFLQHMVRLIVGTMIEVSIGRIKLKQFKDILNCKKLKVNAEKAPAQGLFLNKIYYK